MAEAPDDLSDPNRETEKKQWEQLRELTKQLREQTKQLEQLEQLEQWEHSEQLRELTKQLQILREQTKQLDYSEQLREQTKQLRELTKQLGEQTSTAIYQAACAEGMQKVYKANVIVVGHQGTGKTRLCRNLLGEDFTEDDLVTNGVEVSGCTLEKHTAGTTWQRKEEFVSESHCIKRLARGIKKYEESGKRMSESMQTAPITIDAETMKEVLKKSQGQPDAPDLLTLWDFGGQYVFYTTHQTFLTWRAVYLLVFDLTKELDDTVLMERVGRTGRRPVDSVPDTVGDFLKFWQNSIHIHTEIVGRKGPESVDICPKILLVGTHKDQLGETEEEKTKVAKEKFSKIQEFLDGRPAHDMHVQPYFYAVNNCDQQDAEIKKLKEAIWETIQVQPFWGEEQPLKYVLLEKKLKEISQSKKCLRFEEVLEQGNRYGLKTAEEVLFFLGFYSKLGELVFFNEVGIKEIVILDPQWLINAFASLITVEKYHKVSSPEVKGYWKMLDDRGELDERLVDSVWKKHVQLKENKGILLRICQRFDLLVELPEDLANGQRKKYFVPCVLKNHPNPECYLKMEQIPPLHLMFDGGFCPPGLFHRLVVCCYRKWSSHDQNPYCDYACFMVDRLNHTIMELCNEGDGIFKLMVGSLKSGVNVVDSDSAFHVLSYIRQELDRLISAYFPYLNYSIGFRFPHGLVKLTEGLKTEILESDDVSPPGCREVVETSPYRKWLRNKENTVSPSARVAVYPPDDLVCDLSRRIGIEWEEVAAYLGVERPQIDHLKLNFPSDALGLIRNMLFQWREGMGACSKEERRDKLKKALARAGRYDLVDSLGLQSDEVEKREMRMTGAVPHDDGKLFEGGSLRRYTTEDALGSLSAPTKSDTVKGNTTADLEEKNVDELSKFSLGDSCMRDGKRDLHLAATRDDYQGIGRLIDEGADINSQDKAGRSSLHIAAENGCIKVVKCLIVKGADVNVQDNKGRSSIYLALENCHGNIATMLYDAGADLPGLRYPVPNEDEIKMGRIIQDKACDLAEKHSSLCGMYPACTFHKGGAKKVPYFVIACDDKEKKAEFPSQLEDYAILVKEGSVKFFSDSGEQQGEVGASCELFIGCPVGVSKTNGYGSLGFFTNTETDDSQVREVKPDSFITCYHVVGAYSEPPDSSVGRPIASRVCKRECGRVRKSFVGNIPYDSQIYGVDATLIALNGRAKAKLTPQIQNNNSIPFVGHLDVQNIDHDEVVHKYGCQTGYTTGHYSSAYTFWRGPVDIADPHARLSFYNMIKVLSVPKPECSVFSRKGDSGAAVFVIRDGSPRIIGLFVGKYKEVQQDGSKFKSAIVSRIVPTLRTMGASIHTTK